MNSHVVLSRRDRVSWYGQLRPGSVPLLVRLDRDVEDLVVRFLARKKNDVEYVRKALIAQDFEKILELGHDLKGAGEGFGFPELSAFGASLECAARTRHDAAVLQQADAMEHYLTRVRTKFS